MSRSVCRLALWSVVVLTASCGRIGYQATAAAPLDRDGGGPPADAATMDASLATEHAAPPIPTDAAEQEGSAAADVAPAAVPDGALDAASGPETRGDDVPRDDTSRADVPPDRRLEPDAAPDAATDARVGGLVAYWKLDEGGGTAALDSSGRGNDGTAVGGADWRTGNIGSALAFDGVARAVGVPATSALDEPAQLNRVTVMAWVQRTANVSGWSDVVARLDPNSYQFGLSFKDGVFSFNVHNKTSIESCKPTPPPPGRWTHLAGTYDGATLRAYADGVQVCAVPFIDALKPATTPLVMGGSGSATALKQPFAGLVDEVVLYSRALGPDEIAQIAAGGAPPLR